MMCEACGSKVATVHWTEMVNDTVKKMHLCEACAAAKGLDVNNPAAFSEVLLGLGAQKEPAVKERDEACPLCHMRLSDFKKTSRLGCQACYETFAGELKPLLEAMHKGNQHVGKVPTKYLAASCAPQALAVLRKALESAVVAEKYEEAARLRDQIRQCTEKTVPARKRSLPDKS